MAEPIKQEIVNTIYDNGEGLITGPVLQEVLLDIVDDYNDKVQTVDLSDRTGSWDDASDWVTENSGSIPTDEDLAILTGSIENWVEDQNYATTASVNELSESLNERIDNIITGSGVDLSGYLTTASYQIDSASFDERINSIPIPDLSEYATTESLNQLSESLAQEIADIDIPDISGLATTSSVEELSSSLNERIDNIPQVDLSGYATTESVNEATQSVKEWVEAKHYLTTASLSGSVTEETVGFMINDATASVKDWVEDQNYATTQSVTDLSSSIAETISEITGSDLSGYLTTASYLVDSASFDERIENIDIPDVSIYATTESLNNLSESIAETYATEEFVSSSIADIQIPSIEGLATTESVNQLSESVAQTIADLPQVDLSGYATTSSVNTLVNETSESVKSWVEEQGYLTEHQDISGLATTSSVNELSESLNQRIDDIDVPDVSIYATTASVNELSESLNSVSSSFDQRISEITGSDLSGYLTTASYLVDSASFDQRIESIPQVDLSGYATTSSVNTLSQSFADTIDNLEIPDVSGLATTESVLQVSESVYSLEEQVQSNREDFDLLSENWDTVRQAFEDAGVLTYEQQEEETTYEVHAVTDTEFSEFSASVDSRINNITGSGVDLSGYATTASVNQLSSSIAQDFDNLDIPDVSGFATTSSLTALSESVANDFDNLDIPDVSIYATTSSVNQLSESVAQAIADIPDVSGLATTSSVTSLSESVAQDFDNLEIPDVSGYLLTSSYQVDSASFDQRINNISGSDLSIYATTESVDSLAETVDEHTQDIQNLWNANIGYDDIQDITNLAIGYVPNYYCEITESVTLGFGGYPEDGQTISINVHNLGASASLVNIPDTLDSFTCVVNGVEGSGSCSIPAGEYGDIVVTKTSDKLYFRTSIDVSNISVDLSGYATTSSVTSLSSSIADVAESVGGIQADVEYLGGEIENIRSDLDGTSANWDNVRQTFEQAGVLTYEIVDDEVTYTSHAALEGDVASLSASLDSRINNISGSDLSIYATTSSVNQLSESLNSVSASFDTRINSITGSGGDSGIWERGLTSSSAIHKGAGNQASGACALAVGFSNKAIGNYTYAQGYKTVATGTASCAQGWGTSASGYAETALGVYNNKLDNQIFSVGCGFSNTSRRNAISVIWDSGSVGGQTNTGSAEVYAYGVGDYLGQDTASALSLGKAYTLHNNYLFNYSSQSINNLDLSYSHTVYTNINADTRSVFITTASKDGATVKIVIHNSTSTTRSPLIPGTYGGYTYRFNGALSGSLEIPGNQERCIYVTRRGTTLYLDSPVTSTEFAATVGNIEAALQALR